VYLPSRCAKLQPHIPPNTTILTCKIQAASSVLRILAATQISRFEVEARIAALFENIQRCSSTILKKKANSHSSAFSSTKSPPSLQGHTSPPDQGASSKYSGDFLICFEDSRDNRHMFLIQQALLVPEFSSPTQRYGQTSDERRQQEFGENGGQDLWGALAGLDGVIGREGVGLGGIRVGGGQGHKVRDAWSLTEAEFFLFSFLFLSFSSSSSFSFSIILNA